MWPPKAEFWPNRMRRAVLYAQRGAAGSSACTEGRGGQFCMRKGARRAGHQAEADWRAVAMPVQR
ncbi:hypothetical protein ABIB25_001395 [Nakamurella sp. UYEF19]